MVPFIPANIHYIISLALIAPSLGGALIFSFGIMGAVVDYDEKLTNQRREALFYGVFSLASGIGMSVSTLILPFAYNTFGYTKRTPMVQDGIFNHIFHNDCSSACVQEI